MGCIFSLLMNAQLAIMATSSLASSWNLTPNLSRLQTSTKANKTSIVGRGGGGWGGGRLETHIHLDFHSCCLQTMDLANQEMRLG